jgi:MinD-like ATPase involved in chromosome partitioning or flagellar assembly
MTLSVLLAGAGESWESGVVRALQAPGSRLRLVRRCVDVADALATAASGQGDAVLLGRDLPGVDADAVSRLRADGVVPILLHATPDTDTQTLADLQTRAHRLSLPLVECTAPDFPGRLLATVSEHRVDSTNAARTDAAGTHSAGTHSADYGADALDEALSLDQPDASPPGRLIAVWGPTGAPGRSTVALNLAAESAGLGVRTLLIDADVYGGSLAPMLAVLDEVSGLLAAARSANVGALDEESLLGHTRLVSAGLSVLTGLPRADRWPQLRPGAFAAVLAAARRCAELVVVDCGFNLETDEELVFDVAAPRRNGATLQALEDADVVLAVGAADPIGLMRLARGVVDLVETVPGVDVRLVVNRVRPSLGWSAQEVTVTVRRFTGLQPVAFLPVDTAGLDRALVTGRTLLDTAPESPLRRELQLLTGELLQLAVRDRRGRRLVRKQPR